MKLILSVVVTLLGFARASAAGPTTHAEFCAALLRSSFGHSLARAASPWGNDSVGNLTAKFARADALTGADREAALGRIYADLRAGIRRKNIDSDPAAWGGLAQLVESLKSHYEWEELKIVLDYIVEHLDAPRLPGAQLDAVVMLIEATRDEMPTLALPLVSVAREFLDQAYIDFIYYRLLGGVDADAWRTERTKLLEVLKKEFRAPVDALTGNFHAVIGKLIERKIIAPDFALKADGWPDFVVNQIFEPARLERVLRLIRVLPAPQGPPELARVLKFLNEVAREADGPRDDRNSRWKRGRQPGQSVLDFSGQALSRGAINPDFDPVHSLQRNQIDLIKLMQWSGITVSIVLPALLALEPSPETTELFRDFAALNQSVLSATEIEPLIAKWTESNLKSSAFITRYRGGLEPYRGTYRSREITDAFGSGSVPSLNVDAEATHFYMNAQMSLAKYLLQTGEIENVERGVKIVREFRAEQTPVPGFYDWWSNEAPYQGAGYLNDAFGASSTYKEEFSPFEFKLNALLSAAKMDKSQQSALVEEARKLNETRIHGDQPPSEITLGTIIRLMDGLLDTGHVDAVLELHARWFKSFIAAPATDDGPAGRLDEPAALIMSRYYQTAVMARTVAALPLSHPARVGFIGVIENAVNKVDVPPSTAVFERRAAQTEAQALINGARALDQTADQSALATALWRRAINLVQNRAVDEVRGFVRATLESALDVRTREELLLKLLAKPEGWEKDLGAWVPALIELAHGVAPPNVRAEALRQIKALGDLRLGNQLDRSSARRLLEELTRGARAEEPVQ